jgi:glycosyltransferase involved in cell wall biosynthesis
MAQTLPPQEVIVVDDGSSDGSIAIVERLKNEYPITLIRKQNGGQSSARNHGVGHSNARLIAFLDHDDLWYPNHLERLATPFCEERHSPLGWVYSNVDEIDGHGYLVARNVLDLLSIAHPKLSLFRCLSEDMFVLPSSSLISREAFERATGFDERLSGYEDDDLFLRLFRLGYANIYINRPLTAWRITGSTSSYTLRMAESRMTYAAKLFAEFPDEPILARFWGRDVIAPRFIRNLLAEYRRTIGAGMDDVARRLVDDLGMLKSHASLRHQILLTIIMPILRQPRLARASLPFWPLARRLLS